MNVVSFYRFVDVADPAHLARDLQMLCDREDLLGTILVAREGVNGTLYGHAGAVQAVLNHIEAALALDPRIDTRIEARWTEAATAPFRRMRVRLKNEIVTLGRPDIEPQRKTGTHVAPAEWNALIDKPETLVIDTRNHYEIELGSFPRAVDPGTDSFRQFPQSAERLSSHGKDRPVAMFCTGGIRCEKASALMLELGYTEVYQLQGGILNYLEKTGEGDNRWHGDCFVFDSRVTVDRDLAEGGYVQCHACRRPLSTADLASPAYREGVSCPRCTPDSR